jgi:hypothetical protein
MECFETTYFDNNNRLITLTAILKSGLHCKWLRYLDRENVNQQNKAINGLGVHLAAIYVGKFTKTNWGVLA